MATDKYGTQNDNISVKTNLIDIDDAMNDYLGTLTSSPQGSARVRVNSLTFDNLQPSMSLLPTSPDSSIGDFSLESPVAWRLSNAVHMEVQENAKVPTFNWNIDRSNSSTVNEIFSKHNNYSQNFSSENGVSDLSNQQQAPSMEFFFNREKQRGRSSVNDSYLYNAKYDGKMSSKKPVPINTSSNITKPVLDRNRGISDSSIVFDEQKLNELTMGVNPTPLDEIMRRHSPAQTPSLPYIPSIIKNSEPSINSSNSGFQFYVPRQSSTAKALQTKAISSTTTKEEGTTVTDPLDQTNPKNENIQRTRNGEFFGRKKGSVVDSSSSGLSFEQLLRKQRNLPHHQDHLRQLTTPQHATAHVSSSGAMMNASNKKSQYGFGSKHVVPAVPRVDKIDQTRNDAPTKKPINEEYLVKKNQSLPIIPNLNPSLPPPILPNLNPSQPYPTDFSVHSPDSPRNGRNGEAYERKKARAKNARVMLNDSIDRLGVAMNLAGSQSGQRVELVNQMKREKQSLPSILGSESQVATLPNRYNNEASNNSCASAQSVMENCVNIARTAAKWDRPKFVGSAASMIQTLNSQCEMLMRELGACHTENVILLKQHQQRLIIGSAKKVENDALPDETGNDPNSENYHKRRKLTDSASISSGGTEESDVEAYHRRLAIEVAKTQISAAILQERNAMDKIMSFLEPTSIAKCLLLVSKAWKRGHCFSVEPLWRELCIKRFGAFNVRQWQDKLEPSASATELERQNSSAYDSLSSRSTHSSAMTLYRIMDDANVVPHFFRSANMIFLGESRLPGKASAWTFLMETSNGETQRSVLREPDPSFGGKNISTQYTSMPVVRLWTVIQNTSIAFDEPIIIRDQIQTVDASTRRRKDEMMEIHWDNRLNKRILDLDGTPLPTPTDSGIKSSFATKELCRLELYDSVIIETYIHAKGCSTTSKFIQRSNHTKIIVQLPAMISVPLVIPFPQDYVPIRL